MTKETKIKIEDLIKDYNCKAQLDLISGTEISGLSCNSMRVKAGDVFFAISGETVDGHDYAIEAVKKGALFVVIEKEIRDIAPSKKIFVKNSKDALVNFANRYYDFPSRSLRVIGVTGTNGKTTVSSLIENALNYKKNNCGLIGTINYKINDKTYNSVNTTPGSMELIELFSQMRSEGLKYASMEVSSHALHQERLKGIDFRTAILTNITGDHLDYHKTFDNYLKAKLKLFSSLGKNSNAVINIDDKYSGEFISSTRAKVITYGIKKQADIFARSINSSLDGSSFSVDTPKGSIDINTHLVGTHNVYNLLAAISALFLENLELDQIKIGIESLGFVEGRLEKVKGLKGFTCFIDFAHTHDAITNILTSLRPLTIRRLMIVFGCGGDRDKSKRAKMGKAASMLSDYFIITNDNPRSENPEDIAKDIMKGIKKNCGSFEVILDRESAIEKIMTIAQEGDVVVIAGKGHENYQIFCDRTVEFSDKAVVEKYLKHKISCKLAEIT